MVDVGAGLVAPSMVSTQVGTLDIWPERKLGPNTRVMYSFQNPARRACWVLARVGYTLCTRLAQTLHVIWLMAHKP